MVCRNLKVSTCGGLKPSATFDVSLNSWGYLPRMQSALVNLQAAKRNLINASHDKGGHRSNALVLMNQAIVEVKKGIRYYNKY